MFEFLTHPIPAVVILLGLLVFFHEFGHFIVGRLCGIAVETFSIGFGPRIFGFTHKGTEYRLSWVPLGGYVKFAGAHPSEEVPPGLAGRAFLKTSLGKRAATVVAGPAANFVLAICVYAVLGMGGIPHPPALIGDVIEGSAAERAGIKFGDRMVKIDSRTIATWRDLEEVISVSPQKTLNIVVVRNGQEVPLRLTPEEVKTTDMAGRPVSLGRAGIALGRMPAVVTLLASNGEAALAGLKTGDKILAVNATGEEQKIESLPELAVILRKIVEGHGGVGLSTVKLIAQATEPPKDDADPKATGEAQLTGTSRTVELRVGRLMTLPPNASDREVFKTLGFRDSQMTLADVTDGAVGVLQPGDVLLAWNDQPVRDVFMLREQLITNSSPEAKVTVLRNFAEVTAQLKLKGIDTQRPEGPVTIYTLPGMFWGQPIEPAPIIEQYSNPLAATWFGLKQTASQTKELINNVASLVTGDIPLKALGGPMLIAKVAGDSARRGWQTFLGSMALISINLGLLNLFPIPVLDGGQLVLMGAEGIRRRPLRETAVENFQKVGFAMIMALVVLATYNDLSRFWKSMLESVLGIFQ